MISLIVWLVLGFIAGFLAKVIMPGPDNEGYVMTTILGIVGAVVGGAVGHVLGFHAVSSFENIGSSIPSFIFSIIGAVIVLVIYRLIVGRSLRA